MSLLELLRQIDPEKYEISLYVLMAQGELVSRVPDCVHILNQHYVSDSVLSENGRGHMKKMVIRAAVCRGNLIRQLPYLVQTLCGMIRRKRLQPDKLLWQLLAQGAKRFDEKYDLAVAYLEGGSAYYVADYVAAEKKAAFIHIDYEQAGYTRAIDQSCYLKYDHIFTVSDEGKQTFLKVYPECADHISLFHNPVDRERLLKMSSEKIKLAAWTDYVGVRLLTVGRLNPQKAYEVAIETMRLLKQENIGFPVRWFVLGEGSERQRLEQQIHEAGLEQDFLLVGAVDNPYPYYAECDLYVHATRFEGRSIAIQEAQALGCAVLASDCSGNREQIKNGVDGVLEELVPEKLKAKIISLLKDKQQMYLLGNNAEKKMSIHLEDIQELLTLADHTVS